MDIVDRALPTKMQPVRAAASRDDRAFPGRPQCMLRSVIELHGRVEQPYRLLPRADPNFGVSPVGGDIEHVTFERVSDILFTKIGGVRQAMRLGGEGSGGKECGHCR